MILMQSRPNAKHKQTTKKKSNLCRLSDELQLSSSVQPSNSMLLLSCASALAFATVVVAETQHLAHGGGAAAAAEKKIKFESHPPISFTLCCVQLLET